MLLAIFIAQSLCQRTISCTDKTTMFDLTESNYNQIIGGPRAVFVRMENEGCPFAAASQKYWKEASELFPNIIFVRAECIYNSNVCKNLGASVSPSHALFPPNSTKSVYEFGNVASTHSSSSYYANIIYQNLGFYPFDTATIDDLIPESTSTFFSSYKYPVFILYDSNCNEDSDFVAQWIIYATDEHISSDDYGFGKLDCSKYPDECLKWGSTHPSANVFSREKAISASITETDHLSERVKSAIAFLDDSDQVFPTPGPYLSPLSTPVPVISNVRKITTDSLQNRDVGEVRNKYNSAKQRSNDGADYTGDAEVYNCNDVSLKTEVLTDSVRLVNFFRELAGVPATITNDVSLNYACQLAAKYSSRTGRLSHDINDYFKDVCSFADEWELIRKTLKESNLANGKEHVLDLIMGQFDDEGSNNEGVVGHRRWLLYPYLKSIGVGFYPTSKHQMTGYSLQFPPSAVFGLNYGTYSVAEYDDVNFIAWPPAGPFPYERLPTSWSVYYKEFQREDVTVDDVTVTLTRDDGQVLECSRVDLSKDTSGMPGTLVFKLTDESFKLVTAGHSIHVQVYLLKGSTRDCIDYTVDFFDDQKEGRACFYKSDASKCPSTVSEANRFGNGQYGNYRPMDNQRTIIHVAEDISLESDLLLDFSSTFIIKGARIKGKVVIGSGSSVDIHDASATDVVIKTDPNGQKSGVLRTPGSTKSVTVEFTSNPTQTLRFRILVYSGCYAGISYQKKVSSGDYNYYFTATYSGKDTYLVCTPVSYIEYACHGGDRPDYNIDSTIKCFAFSESNELKNIVTKKKMIRVYSEGGELTVSASNLPDSYVDYEFLSTGTVKVQYSKALDHRARKITIRNYKGNAVKVEFSVSELGLPSIDDTMKIYPFTNLYLSNLDPKTNLDGYSIPYLLGDDNAKAMMQTSEKEVFDESKEPFADSSGYYQYKGLSSNDINTPLFITDGLHDEYIFNRTNDIFQVSFRIRPTESTISKPVTISLSKRTDINRYLENVFIQDYKDVTIKAEKHEISYSGNKRTVSYFQNVRLVNVSRARFVDTTGQAVTGIETDITGTVNTDVSTTADKPVTFENLFLRADNVLTATNCACNEAHFIESQPTVKDLKISNAKIYGDSKPLLVNCDTNTIELKFKTNDIFLPTLLLRNTKVVPSSIKVVVETAYDWGAKILSLGDTPTLLFACLDTTLMENLKNGVQVYSDDGFGYQEVSSSHKLVLSKDKKGLYLVKAGFSESNAPATIPADVEYKVSDENFNINPSPPPPQTPQQTYPPPPQTPQQTYPPPPQTPQQTYPPPPTEIPTTATPTTTTTTTTATATTTTTTSSPSSSSSTSTSSPPASSSSSPSSSSSTDKYTATPFVTVEPTPTSEPEDTSFVEITEGMTDTEVDSKLKEFFSESHGSGNVIALLNVSEVNFNTELDDNQFIKPKSGSVVNYNGGKLNLQIPDSVTVLIDDAANSKLSFKGEGNINLKVKEGSEPKTINLNRNSQINGTVTLNVPSHVESLTMESLELESSGELSVHKEGGNEEEKVKVTVNKVNAVFNTNAKIKGMTIKQSLNLVQTSTLTVEDVTLNDATINYEIRDFSTLNGNPFFKGSFNEPPSSIVLNKIPGGPERPSSGAEYALVTGMFEQGKCEEWLTKINYGNSGFSQSQCLANTHPLLSEDMRIVLQYTDNNGDDDDDGNGGKKKLSVGVIIGIVVGVVVVVGIVVGVTVFIVIKRRKGYEKSTEGADDMDELEKQQGQNQNDEKQNQTQNNDNQQNGNNNAEEKEQL